MMSPLACGVSALADFFTALAVVAAFGSVVAARQGIKRRRR